MNSHQLKAESRQIVAKAGSGLLVFPQPEPPKIKPVIYIDLDLGNGPVRFTAERARKFAMDILNCHSGIQSDIWDAVCDAFGVTNDQLTSRNRSEEIANVRHILCYFLKRSGHSLSSIGASMNRDHGTVFNSLKVYERIKDRPLYQNKIAEIEQKLSTKTDELNKGTQ